RIEAFDERDQIGRSRLFDERAARRWRREADEMGAIGWAKLERLRQRLGGRSRRQRIPALFQTDIPIDRDAGALGDLLASQPRRAAPRAGWQAEVVRTQPLASASQELAELLAVARRH